MSDFQLLVVRLLYIAWDCRNGAISADEKIDLASFFNKLNRSFSEHKHLSKNGLSDHPKKKEREGEGEGENQTQTKQH